MTLLTRFTHPVADSQRAFRRILKAMSEPGVIVSLPQLPAWGKTSQAATAVLMTLVDCEMSLWLDRSLSNLRFHTGAPVTLDPDAAFALLHAQSDTVLDPFSPGDSPVVAGKRTALSARAPASLPTGS